MDIVRNHGMFLQKGNSSFYVNSHFKVKCFFTYHISLNFKIYMDSLNSFCSSLSCKPLANYSLKIILTLIISAPFKSINSLIMHVEWVWDSSLLGWIFIDLINSKTYIYIYHIYIYIYISWNIYIITCNNTNCFCSYPLL
jgi:hypothetical protein